MHQSTWDLHHSIGIDVPFHCAKFKKIVGANFEKIDKVDFRDIQTDRQTDRHTYRGYLIGPSPSGGPKRERPWSIGVGAYFEWEGGTRFWGAPNEHNRAPIVLYRSGKLIYPFPEVIQICYPSEFLCYFG